VDERLEQLIREGRLTRARRPGPSVVTPLRLKGKLTVDEVLAEDRGE
jgi:hypothetical protein